MCQHVLTYYLQCREICTGIDAADDGAFRCITVSDAAFSGEKGVSWGTWRAGEGSWDEPPDEDMLMRDLVKWVRRSAANIVTATAALVNDEADVKYAVRELTSLIIARDASRS